MTIAKHSYEKQIAKAARRAHEGSQLGREPIGFVGVDSGKIMVVDPASAEQYDVSNNWILSDTGREIGVVFDTEIGDGLFPVYENRNADGELVSIEIRILES